MPHGYNRPHQRRELQLGGVPPPRFIAANRISRVSTAFLVSDALVFRNILKEKLGSDLNPEMVAWCGEKFPGATFFSNGVEPPLPFLEDNSVDLVYCYSVFTHIPLELQTPWLQELRRVLRPGGFLICTVAGWRLQKQFVNSADAETLRMKGRLQYTSEDAAASLATQVGGSAWDVYQTRSEVVRVFGAVFALRDYLTIGQDVLVLQKEPVLERGKFLVMHPATYVLPSDPERPAQLNENGHTAPARLSEGDAP